MGPRSIFFKQTASPTLEEVWRLEQGPLVFPAEDVEEMMSGISSTWSVAWSPGNHYSMLEPLVTEFYDNLELWHYGETF